MYNIFLARARTKTPLRIYQNTPFQVKNYYFSGKRPIPPQTPTRWDRRLLLPTPHHSPQNKLYWSTPSFLRIPTISAPLPMCSASFGWANLQSDRKTHNYILLYYVSIDDNKRVSKQVESISNDGMTMIDNDDQWRKQQKFIWLPLASAFWEQL